MGVNIALKQVLISLISPVLALYLAIKKSSERGIVIAGTLFMGFVGSVFIYTPGNDSYTHLEDVYQYYLDMSFIEFLWGSWSLLTFQPIEASNDLYKHIISYLAGGVFGVPELIHLFGGLLLGCFFTKSVLLVLEHIPRRRLGLLLISFIALFLIVRSISALNSLRMWTGMWVFFYGAVAYVKRGQRKYLWVIALAVFIHFSYLLFSIPLVAAIFLRKRKKIVVCLYALSFFMSVGFQQASGLVESTGLYEGKASTNILDQSELNRRANQRASGGKQQNFYKAFGPAIYNSFSTVILSFALILIYLKNKKLKYLDFMIAGALLILALSNLASTTSPSVHGRGYTIAATFLVAAAIQVLSFRHLFLFTGLKTQVINFMFYIFLASAVPHVIFHVSYALNSLSLFIVSTPLASWIMGDEDFSVRDFIAFIL